MHQQFAEQNTAGRREDFFFDFFDFFFFLFCGGSLDTQETTLKCILYEIKWILWLEEGKKKPKKHTKTKHTSHLKPELFCCAPKHFLNAFGFEEPELKLL